METAIHQFSYTVVKDISELSQPDADLLQQARVLTKVSYAPYSNFHVACVARLANGKIVEGTNQENASFPVGICAERSLLAAAGTLFPGEVIDTMAVTYQPLSGESNTPISPCGMCRQALSEYENRVNHPIQLILAGIEGDIFIIDTVKDLLPLAFGKNDLK